MEGGWPPTVTSLTEEAVFAGLETETPKNNPESAVGVPCLDDEGVIHDDSMLVNPLPYSNVHSPAKGASEDGGNAERAKRRRRAPTTFRDDSADMSNEQLRILQQAVENSRAENVSVDVVIEEAPTYHPSVEEFKDPIKYIASITPVASRYGICKIKPPDGWRNPTSLDFKSHERFATKLQRMILMQEGRAMGDGKRYNLKEYEEMAGDFAKKWFEGHFENPESVTLDDLEKAYWKLIKNADESTEIEYANDLSTQEFVSGFPLHQPSDPPLGSTDAAFGTPEYYRICGWNLNNISSWPGSAIRCVTHSIDGVNKPWLYLGMLFASFCWHREDLYLASINYMHYGTTKQWYGIPGSKAKAFKSVLEKQLKLRFAEVPDLEHHLSTQLAPQTLMQNNVPVTKLRQSAGEFVVTFPGAFHAGFSFGQNCAEAVNFATREWLDFGAQAVADYRLRGKKEVLSFDRLLFSLTYRLGELSLASVEMLLAHLEALRLDEAHLRRALFESGVQDVSRVASPPALGKMSAEIPEKVACYDDQRVCAACSHTCFLSAVCCHCSERRAACPRCVDLLCSCPRANKYLLEWHTDAEIARVVAMTQGHIRRAQRAASATS